MPLSPRTRMRNTENIRKGLMTDRMNRDAVDLRTARLEPPIARVPISYAAPVSNKSVKPPKRDLLKEISVCRAENTQLRNLLEKRTRMLSTSISVMEQNGIRIPVGAKKFKRTMKRPMRMSMKKPMRMSMKNKPMRISMKNKPMRMSMKNKPMDNTRRRNMSKRRRR